jgi:hypothetical protein
MRFLFPADFGLKSIPEPLSVALALLVLGFAIAIMTAWHRRPPS